MLPIHINEDEAHLLHLLIRSRLSGLGFEIEHTDAREYREMLKAQHATLEGLLARFPPLDKPGHRR